MNRLCKSSHWLTGYVLLLSLFLQSCSNTTISIEKGSDEDQASIKGQQLQPGLPGSLGPLQESTVGHKNTNEVDKKMGCDEVKKRKEQFLNKKKASSEEKNESQNIQKLIRDTGNDKKAGIKRKKDKAELKEKDRDQEGESNEKEEASKIFIFIRHGITDWNWKMIPDGPKDLPLNETGVKHINSIAKNLSVDNGIKPQRILTSPLIRCIQTKDIIEAELCRNGKNPSIGVEEGLKEINHGDWSKSPKLQERLRRIVRKLDKKIKNNKIDEQQARKKLFEKVDKLKDALIEEYETIGETDKSIYPEKWESFKQRVYRTLDDILDNKPSDTLVISHGAVIKGYLKYKKIFENISQTWEGKDNRPALIVTRFSDGKLAIECFTKQIKNKL